jgi:2-oxoisovalerate dehydrogenase E1 component
MFIDAISNSLKQSMERHDNLVIMGQDIAECSGAFKITDGFVAQFGKERVINTLFVRAQLFQQEWVCLLMDIKLLLKCSLLILFPQDLIQL